MNGIVVLNKPAGRTSFEAVRAVSRLFSKEKAGHSGTLDPMATGVLPVFLGRATKLIPYLPDTEKEYIADVKFGTQTDTGDKEGYPVYTSEKRPNEQDWEAAVQTHIGEQTQIPPMYSAIKKNGVPLYELARKGETVEREPRTINIKEIETIKFDRDSAQIRVKCSAGTYIRTLAEDLAKQCGCYAHLTDLERTYACGFPISEAVSLQELEETEGRERYLVTTEVLFADLPAVELDSNLTRLFMNGFNFPIARTGNIYDNGIRVRVYCNGDFIGVGETNNNADLIKLWQEVT